ncbi:hypothetical protein G6O69_20270 [Pseudenhygromyxa sp. WMMC2535]|uniref:hypothetical protein n=1 Tax=Pseudenhygromyxa sp. WMMC2535 TaxID=2712867 RepID=UPI001551713C|nr:hypothetical protein [Pseudenhygromyxa sp. WMMC2535]NVB40194.1 hypothetical protein [Pseudenhygromyxa sp. WMMC2535]
MLVVTGTPRSGTSMWMQILVAAGFDAIGEPFPGDWRSLLREANPDGYWESQLLGGVYYRSNPHPLTGAFLFPDQTRFHAVKIMIPGLVRSDIAYLDRVVATVREWRQFCASRERLQTMIDQHLGLDPHEELFRSRLPPALEWWLDNFALLRDIATRRYAAHVCSYQSLLDDPHEAIAEVLRWLERGDLDAAVAAVRPQHQTQRAQAPTPALEPEFVEVFDELYDHIHRGLPLSAAFLTKLNETDLALRPQILAHEAQARISAARSLLREQDDSST